MEDARRVIAQLTEELVLLRREHCALVRSNADSSAVGGREELEALRKQLDDVQHQLEEHQSESARLTENVTELQRQLQRERQERSASQHREKALHAEVALLKKQLDHANASLRETTAAAGVSISGLVAGLHQLTAWQSAVATLPL